MKHAALAAALAAMIALLPGPSIAAPGKIADPGEYLHKNVKTARLSNGVTVMMLDRGYAPTLALIISFRVGSVDESYDSIGIAHLLEHMLFKGTDKIGTTDYAREKKIQDRVAAVGDTIDGLRLSDPGNAMLSRLEKELKDLQEKQKQYHDNSTYDFIYSSRGGVNFNASTSRDRTAYTLELPASGLELWAQMESERLRNPVMRGFFTERDTVLEERLMRYDSEGVAALYETFLATAFTAHPYRHPTIGWRSNIPFLSIYGVERFYREHYVPARMNIAVVGRQDTAKTLATLERYFGKLEQAPSPRETAIREPAQKGERRFALKFDANPYLLIGWHKPSYPSRVDYAFDMLASLLADGRTSRLHRSLVLEKKIAASVSAWNGFPGARYDSMFVIAGVPRSPHTAEELEREIYAEIERVRTDLKSEEVRRVKSRMESSMVFEMDSNMGIAGALSYYQTVFNNWRYMADYLPAINSVTEDEIKTAINRYLVADNRTVGILVTSKK